MTNRRPFSYALFLIPFAAVVTRAESTQPAHEIVQFVARLHRSNWSKLTPETVQTISPISLVVQDIDYPADYRGVKPCKPLQSLNGSTGSVRISLEFDAVGTTERCRQHLNGIAVHADLNYGDSHVLLGEFLKSLRPGGHGTAVEGGSEYVWRSVDSKTRYELYVAVSSTDLATPATAAVFKLILKRDSVAPFEVDDLPFEKGFFPKCAK